LVLGLVLLAGAFLSVSATVYAGQHDCGSAIASHAPDDRFVPADSESRVEDQCDAKIKKRRWFVAIFGSIGLLTAMAGAYDHERKVTE
jgi:hypothetical protein